MMLILSGLVLLCAIALPAQRPFSGLIRMCRWQSSALGAAALFQGAALLSAPLIIAGIILIVKAFALPAALRRFAPPALRQKADAKPALAILGGVLLTALATLAVQGDPAAAELGIALAVLLLGLWMMATRNGLAQAAGFFCAGNGMVLAAIAVRLFVPGCVLAQLGLELAFLLSLDVPRQREELP